MRFFANVIDQQQNDSMDEIERLKRIVTELVLRLHRGPTDVETLQGTQITYGNPDTCVVYNPNEFVWNLDADCFQPYVLPGKD